jgi:Tfp pilus assembly protein PilF
MLADIESGIYKDKKAADGHLKEAFRIAQNDSVRSSIVSYQADVLHGEEQKAKAYKLYKKALKLNPDNASALNNYAYFLSLDSTDLPRAEQMAARAVELAPGNASYLDTYAWVLFLQGDTQQALKIIKQAVSLDGMANSELLVHYGDILYATGEKFMARMYWRRALGAGHDPAEIEKRLKLP